MVSSWILDSKSNQDGHSVWVSVCNDSPVQQNKQASKLKQRKKNKTKQKPKT